METVDLEMEDIFDGGVEEEDLAVPPPLPDLEDDAPGGSGLGADGGTLNTDNQEAGPSATPVAVKKRVMRPQPKLGVERLQSERGLPMLPKLFKNTKFKGKGHEADDLKLVMGRLEHWAHRLFPKLTFDDFIARLERLGSMKSVQTCIKRIRLDMPMTPEDFAGNPDDGGGHEDNATAGGSTDAPRGSAMDVDEAYEEMLQQERQQMTQQKAATPGGSSANQLPSSAAGSASDEPGPMPSTSAEMSPPAASSSGLSPHRTPQGRMTGSQTSMTPDQLARIERNKQLAMEKRAARLGVSVASLQSPKPTPKVTGGDTLSEMTSDGDNVAPVEAKKATTAPVSSVAVTTEIEMDTNEPHSSDAQIEHRNGAKSSEDREVIDDTNAQDKSNNNASKRTPDGDTMNTEEILDALENDHDDDCADVSVAKGDSPVRNIPAPTKCARNDTSEDISPDLQPSIGVLMNGSEENVSDKTMPGKATENHCHGDSCEKDKLGTPPSKSTLLSIP